MARITARLQVGQLLYGRYRIVRLLGTGGMSVVYLANDEHLAGKQWAIKESRPAFQDVRQLIHEASILTKLRHPHLPLIVDFYPPDDNGKAYLVMEYIEGDTLADHLRIRTLTFKDTMRIVIPLCEALVYLHRQHPSIVFRDVKPSNIMIGKDQQVKLIDFGIARNVNPQSEQDTVKLGTVGFAAPEQYQGQQTDARTDLYSVGVLLGHMLSGGSWKGDKPFAACMLAGDVPDDICSIIARLLEKCPKDRYQTASELLEKLYPFEEGDRIGASVSVGDIKNHSSSHSGSVIAFLGTASGLGTTHAALMCANVLAQHKGRTLYMDANRQGGSVIQALAQEYEGEEELYLVNGEMFKLFGMDCMEWKDGTNPLPSLLGAFDYIVLDLGYGNFEEKEERMIEFIRADVPVLISSLAPWRRKDILKLGAQFEQLKCNRWLLAVPFWNRAMNGKFVRNISKRGVIAIPLQADPFACSEEMIQWVHTFVSSVQSGRFIRRIQKWIIGKRF